MGRLVRALLPQRYRLKLWLLRHSFARESLRLRRAQPSLLQRQRARVVLNRRARRAMGRRSGVARLSAVMVINLRARPDRLAAFTEEMDKLGIDGVHRFDAISDDNAALGCSLSHVECAKQLLANGWESMMVCEDDVAFRLDRPRLDVLVDEFLDDAEADVACLAYFVQRSRPHSTLYLRGTMVRTMACYVVKRRVVEDLVAAWLDGIEQMRRGGSANRYICDKAWIPLQEVRVFLVPVVRAAVQRESYSEIQGRVVSYGY
jgi:hypothetical protein